jgi:hypothetical protein
MAPWIIDREEKMFAKVFGQIFDSSIAEDYNCRRMFMDLLVLADSTGAVDMTHEAISRRTNVPVDEVVKYVKDLCQPDTKSRSKLEEGKRLVPLDSNRDWGWKIVNYVHYRKIRDEAARREYFRDKQREHRKKNKRGVKDIVLTELNTNGQVLTPPSSSTSASFWEELKRNPLYSGVDIDRELEKAKQWCKKNSRRLTERFFTNWLSKADRLVIPTSRIKTAQYEPHPEQSDEEREKARLAMVESVSKLRDKMKMP